MEKATSLHIASVLFLVMLSFSMVHTSVVELDDLVVDVLDDTMSVLEEERNSKRYEQITVISQRLRIKPFKRRIKAFRQDPKISLGLGDLSLHSSYVYGKHIHIH